MNFYLKSKLNYWLKARHRKGFGIHSPFLFHLITRVIENKDKNPDYQELISFEQKALAVYCGYPIDQLDLLYGYHKIHQRTPRQLFKHAEIEKRYIKLILRLIRYFNTPTIHYFGPTPGFTPQILSSILEDRSVVHVIPRSLTVLSSGSDLIGDHCLNLKIVDDKGFVLSKSDFAILNHFNAPTECEGFLQKIIENRGEDTVVIIRGIHRNEGMNFLWLRIISHSEIRISLDLFGIGILFLRPNLQKENFTLRF